MAGAVGVADGTSVGFLDGHSKWMRQETLLYGDMTATGKLWKWWGHEVGNP